MMEVSSSRDCVSPATHAGRFVAYYRVSTSKQGKSGLGREAQEASVKAYLNGGRWKLIAEFAEVESGKRSDRPELDKALVACRLHRAKLIVAKVDRLTRSVAFLSRLLEAGVDVLFCDLPAIEGPTGRFMLQQMACVAELEAGLISARTTAALAAAKARGVELGRVQSKKLTDEARALGRTAIAKRTADKAADYAPVIREIQAAGTTSLSGIAAALTERGIPTPRAQGTWQAVQVGRVLTKLQG
jgi:DNA invertase Pin-like site-specific DNA recombinase